jgi:ArsR family transcriptional regulator
MADDTDITALSDFFKIMADSTRLKIVWALDQHEMCVNDIAALLDMTKSAVSHQLSVLKDANLVKNRREGRVVFYSPADEHVKLISEMGMEHIREKKENEK